MLEQLKEALRNWGTWVSIFSLLFLVLIDAGVGIDPGRYELYVNLILMTLVGLGVISNPGAGKWYKNIKGPDDLDK